MQSWHQPFWCHLSWPSVLSGSFFFIFSHLGAINFLIRIYERLVIFGPFSIYNCAWTFSFQQNLISGISCSEYEKSSLLFVFFLLLSFLYSVLSEWTLSCLFFILRKLHHLLNFISETFSFCNQHHSPNTFYSTVPIATCRCWLQSGWDNSGVGKSTFTTNNTLRSVTNTCPDSLRFLKLTRASAGGSSGGVAAKGLCQNHQRLS